MTQNRSDEPRDEAEPVVVRDRRRIDPETGERRSVDENGAEQVTESMSGTLDDELVEVTEAGAAADSPESAPAVADGGELDQLRTRNDELTADIQRVTAEYANYRKRVERDREAVVNSAKASVAEELLTVLDDIERADSHGDLTGAFKAVTDKLIDALDKSGLEGFGAEGDEFDPAVHEAVQHSTSAEVAGPTVTTVMRRGYRFGDRILRPAMVGVTDYEAGPDEVTQDESASGDEQTEQA